MCFCFCSVFKSPKFIATAFFCALVYLVALWFIFSSHGGKEVTAMEDVINGASTESGLVIGGEDVSISGLRAVRAVGALEHPGDFDWGHIFE